jgi:hypothetical protein
MTLKGWIGYLQCWFLGHKPHWISYSGAKGRLCCSRCPQYEAYTLPDRWQQLQDWRRARRERSKDSDGMPF